MSSSSYLYEPGSESDRKSNSQTCDYCVQSICCFSPREKSTNKKISDLINSNKELFSIVIKLQGENQELRRQSSRREKMSVVQENYC